MPPVTSTASQGWDFDFPKSGKLVEIGFANGRSDQPIVRNFYSQGKKPAECARNAQTATLRGI